MDPNDSHCVKIVRIRSFSGTYFLTFGLNTEILNFRTQSEWENADQKNSEYGHFARSAYVNYTTV